MPQASRRAAALLCLVFIGCQPEAVAPPPELQGNAPRIVSLAPHLTELVYSAGAQDRLVGVVEYSDFPPAASALPRVGDAFALDVERLVQLAPTLVLAWEGGNPAAVIESLRTKGFRVETLGTGGLSEVAVNLRRIGALSGTEASANAAARQFEGALAQLSARFADAHNLSAFFQIGEQPVYTVGGNHSITDVLSICGASNVFATLDVLAATVTDEAVVAADADVMLTIGDVDSLQRWARFDGRAQRANTFYSISADTITRDSLRVLDGAREVCDALDDARRKLAATAN